MPFGAGRELPLRRPKVKIPIPAESAYVYTAGERYASARSRHQNCNTTECTKKIPPNMGWLWSHRPLPGVKKVFIVCCKLCETPLSKILYHPLKKKLRT